VFQFLGGSSEAAQTVRHQGDLTRHYGDNASFDCEVIDATIQTREIIES
jgi:hypothetical protein